jgi:hypothetical protein
MPSVIYKNICLFSQLGFLEIAGVKHAVYNGENLIGRDASCCSVSVSSKVGLDYRIHVTLYMFTHIPFSFTVAFYYLPQSLSLLEIVAEQRMVLIAAVTMKIIVFWDVMPCAPEV